MTKTPGETKRPSKWVGILFGFSVFFAALCALFLLVVTAGVAWQEYCERHWPEATATIQQCSLEEVAETPPSNLIDSQIDCQIAYVVGDRTVMSRVRSMTAPAPEKVIGELHSGGAKGILNKMQDWVKAHPPGSAIAIHYDPANHARAALVATDMPNGGPQSPKNVRFTELALAFSAALLMIATLTRRLSLKKTENSLNIRTLRE